MTRLSKSDAQLDAEAAARKMALGAEWTPATYGRESGYRATPSPPPKIVYRETTTLTMLRASFLDETQIHRLTTSSPPVVRQLNKIEKPDGKVYFEVDEGGSEPPDQIGRSLSAEMVQLIGAITVESSFYSQRHPVRRALSEWERICRRRHRGGSWWDHANEPICGLMVRDIVEGGASVLWCAERYGLSYPRADRLIGAGATFVSDRLAKWDDERLGITHDPKTCDICWRSAHETA